MNDVKRAACTSPQCFRLYHRHLAWLCKQNESKSKLIREALELLIAQRNASAGVGNEKR